MLGACTLLPDCGGHTCVPPILTSTEGFVLQLQKTGDNWVQSTVQGSLKGGGNG